jgi:hypothetical protein
MNRRFALLTVLALVLIAIGIFRKSSLDDDLKALLAHKAGPEWIVATSDILTAFSRHSPALRSWSINAPDRNAEIAIYIFDSNLSNRGQLSAFRDNCRYLGDGRRIVCDVSLIKNMVRHFDLDKREKTESDATGHIVRRHVEAEDEARIEKHYRTMLTWVLGHELGHLFSRHRGQFYFQQHAFDKAIPLASYCHRIELEADAYLLSVYPNQSGYEDLYQFLYDLVNREIHRQVCPDKPLVSYCDKIYPGTGLAITEKPIAYSTDKSHPDYIIRLLRIIDLIHDREDFGLLAYQARQLISSGLLKPPDARHYSTECASAFR